MNKTSSELLKQSLVETERKQFRENEQITGNYYRIKLSNDNSQSDHLHPASICVNSKKTYSFSDVSSDAVDKLLQNTQDEKFISLEEENGCYSINDCNTWDTLEIVQHCTKKSFNWKTKGSIDGPYWSVEEENEKN